GSSIPLRRGGLRPADVAARAPIHGARDRRRRYPPFPAPSPFPSTNYGHLALDQNGLRGLIDERRGAEHDHVTLMSQPVQQASRRFDLDGDVASGSNLELSLAVSALRGGGNLQP